MEREIINWPPPNRAIETRLADRVTPALFAETAPGDSGGFGSSSGVASGIGIRGWRM